MNCASSFEKRGKGGRGELSSSHSSGRGEKIHDHLILRGKIWNGGEKTGHRIPEICGAAAKREEGRRKNGSF